MIFVADGHNYIQKFTPEGKFIMAFRKEGKKDHDFNAPRGISIHPFSKKVYIADYDIHCLRILNPDLTFSSSFGHHGNDDGQFGHPSDVTCNGTGNVYVADAGSDCIQVFIAEGEFVRKLQRQWRAALTHWHLH